MLPYRRYLLGCAIVCCVHVYSCGGSARDPESSGPPSIVVIPKGTIHEFWKTIHAGAVQAGRETGAEIIWKGPIREDDREEQIQLVETFIGAGADAIVLAPLDNRALRMPVRQASDMGIPTVIIDSALEGEDHISFVATDNYRGGVLAAHHIAELLDGEGSLILIRYQEGSASNTNREEGFRDTIIAEYPDITILSDNQYVGPTTESSYRGCENLLNRFPGVEAIFCPNEPVTFGCLRALEERGWAGEVYLVGFDASEKLLDGLRNQTVHGLVLQDPFTMGYLGVMTALKHINGETVERRIDTGVVLATPENMGDPDISKLYDRDLFHYLD